MDSFPTSMAWLARRDGSVILGHGPFREAPSAPTAGIAFYVQNFTLSDPNPWKTPARSEHLTSPALAARFAATPLECEWQTLDAAPFSVIFQEIVAANHAGVFNKTVPVVTECGLTNHPPGPAIVAAMTRQHAPLQSYGWVDGDRGFAGATPELLFSQNDLRLETMALAGTARSEDREVFAVDEKEIREHEYVAQTLVARLLQLGRVERYAREILDLGPIVHFLTTIGLEMREPKLAENLLTLLHPTPALGPHPRTDETLACLADWRQRLGCPAEFGAPFGLWENGRFDAVVAIRGIWWEQRNLKLPAGCGIIEASRLVNEWRELRLKREAVKRFLSNP
jgi:menaquinone-specific isochorismate synthase